MSHLPYFLQAKLGIPPPELPPRTETLKDDLEVEFGDISWSHAENGPANPIPVKDAVTFIGPATSPSAGFGSKYPDIAPIATQAAANLLRQKGYKVPIIPDSYDSTEDYSKDSYSESSQKRPKLDPEIEYMKSSSYNYEDISIINNAGDKVAELCSMSIDHPWILIRSTKCDVIKDIQDALKRDFALVELHDGSSTEPITELHDPSYTVSLTSGTGTGGGINPSTLFQMKRKGKVVAKALCTYQNGEMNNVGPTLELIEVAKKWRRHGLGSALMNFVEEFYADLFQPVLRSVHGRVLFSVCYVTNAHAARWFQDSHFFHDLDGMGEELGKMLYPPDDEGDENDDE